jgi:hypothetical protein
MEVGKSMMKDFFGNEINVGDFVYYKSNGELSYQVGIIQYVWYEVGHFSVICANNKYCSFYKGNQNVMKMSDEEAMLWKLENV